MSPWATVRFVGVGADDPRCAGLSARDPEGDSAGTTRMVQAVGRLNVVPREYRARGPRSIGLAGSSASPPVIGDAFAQMSLISARAFRFRLLARMGYLAPARPHAPCRGSRGAPAVGQVSKPNHPLEFIDRHNWSIWSGARQSCRAPRFTLLLRLRLIVLDRPTQMSQRTFRAVALAPIVRSVGRWIVVLCRHAEPARSVRGRRRQRYRSSCGRLPFSNFPCAQIRCDKTPQLPQPSE